MQEFDVHETYRDDERAVVEELPTIDEALTPFMQLDAPAMPGQSMGRLLRVVTAMVWIPFKFEINIYIYIYM